MGVMVISRNVIYKQLLHLSFNPKYPFMSLHNYKRTTRATALPDRTK